MDIDLFEEIYELVRQIPDGKISTYGAIARALGDIRASRAVGFALNQNPDPDYTPCYKVINSDGTLGGFSRGLKEKIRRLKADGIEVVNGKIFNFNRILFDEFESHYPLKKIRREQINLRKSIDLEDDFNDLNLVGGLDVSYSSRDKRLACATCIVMDIDGRIVDRYWVTGRINFPYIPTYLSYTELPLYRKLIEKIKVIPSVFLVDGNGILHPYGLGLASHLGVEMNIPTIGVAKNLLYGDIKKDSVFDGKKVIGRILRSKSSKKPIFVSPGHRVSIESSYSIVRKFLVYRIPEPIRQSHIFAKSKIKEIDQQI